MNRTSGKHWSSIFLFFSIAFLAVLLGTFLLFSNTADADRVSPLASWRGFGHHHEEDAQIFSQEFDQREALTPAVSRQEI